MKGRRVLPALLVSVFAFSQFNTYAYAQERTERIIPSVVEEEGEVNFTDITPNHWAYKAIKKLAEEYGIMGGFPDNTFRGNRNLTRYEAAAMLKKLMDKVEDIVAKSSKPTYATKADLDKLRKEFTNELEDLQSETKKLAKDQQDLQKDLDEAKDEIDMVRDSLPKVKWKGEVALRQEMKTGDFSKYDVNSPQYRLRLGVNADKDDFYFGARLVTGDMNDLTNQYEPFMSGRFGIGLDQLYIAAKPWDGAIDLTLGRHMNPFFRKTELVWDEDVTLDGAYLKIKLGEDKGFSLALLGAYDVLDVQNVQPDAQKRGTHYPSVSANVLSGGLAATFGNEDMYMMMLGGNYHQFNNVNNLTNPNMFSWNKRTNLTTSDSRAYISNYQLATGSLAFTLMPNSMLPISLYGDVSYNLGAGKNSAATDASNDVLRNKAMKEALGLIAGLKLGHLKESGNLMLDYKFKMVGTDSVFAMYNEDQLGGTGMMAHEGELGLQIAAATSLHFNAQTATKMNTEGATPYYTLKLGMKHKF
ncbi:MAG: putative porin [Candidatus Sericytochromatia bacterium]